jgi:hypothetical protein
MAAVTKDLIDVWRGGAVIVDLVSTEEERAIAACAEAAREDGATFAVWSCHRGLDPMAKAAKDPLAMFDALASMQGKHVVVLLDFAPWLDDVHVRRRLKDLVPDLARTERRLVLVGDRAELPTSLRTHASTVILPLPSASERNDIVRGALTAASARADADDVDRLVRASAGLGATQIERCVKGVLARGGAIDAAAIAWVEREKRARLAEGLGIEHVTARLDLGDLGGLESFKAWLDERAVGLSPRAERFGLRAPRGVLLLGVQGCGKSLAAKCVATRFGLPLVRLDLPRVLGAGDGTSAEEGMRRAIEAVETLSPVALWVDEIEKGFAGSRGGADSRAARLLGAFSTWLQERTSAVFVVATANDVSGLPPELLRRGRFDELFFVDLPDLDARRVILALHLRKREREPDAFDLATLADACRGFSGAELEQVVVAALHRAYALDREPTDADLRHVARDVVPLSRTYAEPIKELRDWARGRARTAGREGAVVDLFRRAPR